MMEQLINDIFGSWAGVVLSAMGLCAAICTQLPAPSESSGKVYRVLYTVMNWIGCNVKKAANADDAAQAQKKA